MIIPKKTSNELGRLSELFQYSILDSLPEQDFDEIVQMASAICGCPISLITYIDQNRQWFKARLGMEITETKRDFSICGHTILGDDILIVPDTLKDERFFDNPFINGDQGIRFYAGMPLVTSSGLNMGSLCVLDRKPRKLDESQIKALQMLSRQVIKLMELRKKNMELARLTEINNKIISIINHDYISPLSSINSLLNLMEEKSFSLEELKEWGPQVRESVEMAIELSSELIKWSVSKIQKQGFEHSTYALKGVSEGIIASSQSLFNKKNNKVINLIDDGISLLGDVNFIKIICRNLLLNANKFTANGTITFSAKADGNFVEICISDTGMGIKKEQLNKLFQWEGKQSTPGTNGEKGNGIGLLLCKDLVESLGGKIWAENNEQAGASFYFTVPKIQKTLNVLSVKE
jgi:signal transduction histidine kinase